MIFSVFLGDDHGVGLALGKALRKTSDGRNHEGCVELRVDDPVLAEPAVRTPDDQLVAKMWMPNVLVVCSSALAQRSTIGWPSVS